MSIIQKLTEGIVNRDLAKEGATLINKWESTGLLEGLGDDTVRNGMARLLENQAKELLRESSSMQAGDVEGFAAVAFPLVRRVFGSLIANDLVSVQPMSLPSGLIFFLDFVFSPDANGETAVMPRLGYEANTSVYGGGVVGIQLTGGVSLTAQNAEAGPYALNNGYSSPTGSNSLVLGDKEDSSFFVIGLRTGAGVWTGYSSSAGDRLIEFDPDLSGTACVVAVIEKARLTSSPDVWNAEDYVAITLNNGSASLASGAQVRRLTRELPESLGGSTVTPRFIVVTTGSSQANALTAMSSADGMSYPIVDTFTGTGAALGGVLGADPWGLEGTGHIPEIDIKIDAVSVTAVTKKLKAKWTPELGQDLNAYHNLDAEVELTQILSEQIALEIDREILEDLVRGAKAGIRYWSRAAGRFLNRETGGEIGASTVTPDFTGNVSEWYETLIETINDVSAQIHRKTLRGAANFCVVGPEVANILEFTAGFRANVTADSDRGDAGAVKVGSLSKKFDIIVDPYFPRNLILVGRRGSSFLESGYVYAPYVPLQTTPTIFGVEDFVPRKGVMTRYAKKMVRPDMYGLVVVRDLV